MQVMTIMFDKKTQAITIHTIPLEDTSIRKDSRKRAPSVGHRVGKLFRHRSSGSGKIKKRPSFFSRLRKDKSVKALDSPGYSSSGTPSPKLPSSPHRSESIKDKVAARMKFMKPSPRRRHTPVSPLARSTSPVALAQMLTPNSSPPGSTQNLTGTPPNSPPTLQRRPERHSMIVESQLIMHKKSHSASELTPPGQKKGVCTINQTSPLLKRAVSPSESRNKPRRSVTLPRSQKIKVPVQGKASDCKEQQPSRGDFTVI